MILKGTKFTKKANGVKFIVVDEIGDDIHFQEEHYMNTKVLNKDIFHILFEKD